MATNRLAVRLVVLLGCGIALAAASALALARQAPEKRAKPATPAPTAKQADAGKQQGKSILSNGGFEEGDPKGSAPDGWKTGAAVFGWSLVKPTSRVQYRWDRKVAHQGQASLYLRKKAEDFRPPFGQWYQEVKRTGTLPRLKVSAFVKANKVTNAHVEVQFLDKNGNRQFLERTMAIFIGAHEENDPPATHDWKRYEGIVEIPDGTVKFNVAPQIWGPGEIWFDDVETEYTDAEATDPTAAQARADAPAMPDVPSEERTAQNDPRKRYFLIGAKADAAPPADGYRLLLVLPGGDGSADFQPFIRNIHKKALPAGYLIAELVAPAWTSKQAETVVWPTALNKPAGTGFTTEQFVDAVVADVARSNKLDRRYIFTLGWSSGGPPVYATALRSNAPVTGTFVAMSIFQPKLCPPLSNARGRSFYILHSPDDFISIQQAESARDELRRAGAKTELKTYEGGHGWHGEVFGEIRRGIEWLEANHSEPVAG